MKEIKGNLWDVPSDAICITTNGTLRRDGSCVMGRGCAAEAKLYHPKIDFLLGAGIKKHGNCVLWFKDLKIFSFPVKHNWWEKADIDLIVTSANQLKSSVDNLTSQGVKLENVVIPRPGCGNGQLKWTDVKPAIEDILDDRFSIITF